MKKDWKMQIIVIVLFTVLGALVIFPFLLLLGISLSNETDVATLGYRMIPKRIDLTAYWFVLKNPAAILNAYKVTVLFSTASMVLGVLFMAMIAYPLSKSSFQSRSGLSFYLYFTMLFNGGLVPTYILMTQYLHLDDTIWAYVLPFLISPWYVFMIRSFFQDIPGEIAESVLIDGGNEYTIFFKMILPLSKPVLATVALFQFLAGWNNWYTSMLYINDESLISLQYLLQKMLRDIRLMQENLDLASMSDFKDIPSETARMAMAVVAAGPALLIFPFFQKYFVKGLTVGSVKG